MAMSSYWLGQMKGEAMLSLFRIAIAAFFLMVTTAFADEKPLSAEERIQRALDEQTDLDFEVSLEDLAKYISQKHQIQIQIDSNVDRTKKVWVSSLKDISLRAALMHILNDEDLAYVVKDGVLLIATKDRALSTKTYEVHDVVAAATEAEEIANLDQLANVLVSSIEPQSWKASDKSGPGTIHPSHSDTSCALVISQTCDVHELINRVLASLRKKPQSNAAEEKIEQALAERTEMTFPQIPLKDVTDYIKERHQIAVVFDKKTLRSAKPPIIPSQVLVSINTNTSLRSELTMILTDKLSYVVKHEAVLITTPDKSLFTEVYDVHDLLTHENALPDAEALKRLGETIVANVEPKSWKCNHGLGTIFPISSKSTSALIVTQTKDVQERLDTELRDLRKQKRLEQVKK